MAPLNERKLELSKPSNIISKIELRRFITDVMKKAGADAEHAGQLADILICSDYRGHYSHGINRLAVYATDVRTKACAGTGTPTVLHEKGATAWVDGANLLGPVVGNFCMRLAIDKAKHAGIGCVVAKGSNHFGIAGWYANQAMQQGLIGMAFTNTSPCVFPTRSQEMGLGSNPICMAAPAVGGDNFFLDMASTTVAFGKVEVADKKGVTQLPSGWGADSAGMETTSPKEILNGGGLLPLGGQESSGGYKGYGLCMMVEILCGILSGSAYGKNIRKWKSTTTAADLGQCFVAIDPEAFAGGFNDRLQTFLDETRDLQPVDKSKPVLAAGDPEREHMQYCDEMGGVAYHQSQIELSEQLAVEYEISAPKLNA